jgi:hypothetical protein
MDINVYEDLKINDFINSFDEINKNFLDKRILVSRQSSLSNEEVFKIMSKINNIEISDKSNEFIENHSHNGQPRVLESDTDQKKYDYILNNWHVDISHISNPVTFIPNLIAMKMKVFSCLPGNGKTIFVDRRKMLKETPSHIFEWMKNSHLIAMVGQKIEYKDLLAVDQDGVMWPPRIFPCIFSDNIDDTENFMFTSYRYNLLSKDKETEKDYRNFVIEYLTNESNWITWEWSQGDFILWDNRIFAHSYTSGWDDGERVFDRFQSGLTIPRFNRWKYD